MVLNVAAWAATGILIALVLAVVAIACTPVRITADLDSERRPALSFRIAILGCLLTVYSTKRSSGDASAKKSRLTGAKGRGKLAARKMVARAPYVARAAPRFICGIARRVRLEAMSADVSFGLPDPADTGTLYGALTPIVLLLGIRASARVTLRPNFAKAVWKGRGRLAARFTPISLALPVLAFGWSVFVLPRLRGALR